MSLIIREINNSSDRKKFVKLPFSLYKGNSYWVPPIINDELKTITPEQNPAFEFCTAKFWLAEDNGRVVGRIAGIINPKINEKNGEKIARLSRLEAVDDEKVFDLLIHTVEQWAKEQGMDGVSGPLGFTNLDHQGVLVQGFDQLAVVASDYHHEYYHRHLERLGYMKEMDWLEFRITMPKEIPDKVKRVASIVQQRSGYKVMHFTKTSEIIPYKDKIFEIFNESFDSLFGTFRFNQKLIDFYANKFISIFNPKLVKLVLTKEDEIAGFIFAMPSLSKAMQKANGHLFPFGFLHLKKAIEHPDEMDLALTGVVPKYLPTGIAALLVFELFSASGDLGIKYSETTGMLENNSAINEWKTWEHVQHKRKRCYRKMF
ncbi:MAG: GNAT family N-acetyltransferase [Bacteroidales bacterium]|nr:GNAT family N-acetyltransferase [Bacteroidales bacterium]